MRIKKVSETTPIIGNVRENIFRIKVGTSYSGYVEGHITIEYTKTTD